MQEHIRRAHPEHYISKLPATEDSFQLMINTPPSERPRPPPPPPPPTSSSTSTSASNANLAPHGELHPIPSPTDIFDCRLANDGAQGYPHERHAFFGGGGEESSAPNTPRDHDDLQSGSMLPAAAALAQLHTHKLERDWDSEVVSLVRVYFRCFSLLLPPPFRSRIACKR